MYHWLASPTPSSPVGDQIIGRSVCLITLYATSRLSSRGVQHLSHWSWTVNMNPPPFWPSVQLPYNTFHIILERPMYLNSKEFLTVHLSLFKNQFLCHVTVPSDTQHWPEQSGGAEQREVGKVGLTVPVMPVVVAM